MNRKGRVSARAAPPDYRALREAARAALRQQSRRSLAKQIGISPSGLRYLLNQDGAPYGPTLRKLRVWHVRQSRAGREVVDAAAPSAVALLVEMLPPDAQPAARGHLLDALRRACEDTRHPLPPAVAAALATQARPAHPTANEREC